MSQVSFTVSRKLYARRGIPYLISLKESSSSAFDNEIDLSIAFISGLQNITYASDPEEKLNSSPFTECSLTSTSVRIVKIRESACKANTAFLSWNNARAWSRRRLPKFIRVI